MKYSSFLPYINNEKTEKNPQYKQRLTELEHFRMLKWVDDTTVFPKESEWFGVFDPSGNIVNL